jgi:hypothetical protein
MKSLVPFLVPCLFITLAACATTTSAGPVASIEAPAAEPEPRDGLEPGSRVMRGDLRKVDAETLAPAPFPANVAKTVFSADGCENGPGGVAVTNATEFTLELKVDGKDVTVLGEKAVAKVVPSRSTVYLCLDPKAAHAISGTLYKLFGDTVYALPEGFVSDLEVSKEGPSKFAVTYTIIAKRMAAPAAAEE